MWLKETGKISVKDHIIDSEMLDAEGVWKPNALLITRDADKLLTDFIEKHKGEISLCSIQAIIEQSARHQIIIARLNSIKF